MVANSFELRECIASSTRRWMTNNLPETQDLAFNPWFSLLRALYDVLWRFYLSFNSWGRLFRFQNLLVSKIGLIRFDHRFVITRERQSAAPPPTPICNKTVFGASLSLTSNCHLFPRALPLMCALWKTLWIVALFFLGLAALICGLIVGLRSRVRVSMLYWF